MGNRNNFNEATETLRRFYAVVDKKPHNRDALNAFFTDNFKDHNRPPAPAEISDRDVVLNLFYQLNRGFPDAKHELIIVEPIENDRAMVYWKFSGTHSGSFFDMPASENSVAINGVDIVRVNDGKFIEQWHVEELASLFAQMGAK
ncbi:MAG: ester cyclase [Gammaproteobacteria bacterium]|nr:ester cyclase [Gammaproteobacteria bacterium]